MVGLLEFVQRCSYLESAVFLLAAFFVVVAFFAVVFLAAVFLATGFLVTFSSAASSTFAFAFGLAAAFFFGGMTTETAVLRLRLTPYEPLAIFPLRDLISPFPMICLIFGSSSDKLSKIDFLGLEHGDRDKKSPIGQFRWGLKKLEKPPIS